MVEPSAEPVLCPVIVSRSSELAALDSVISAARSGRAGVAFLVGEPGIGKSRLSREAGSRAKRSMMTVLRGRAVPSAVPVPYRPLIEALAPAIRRGGVAADLRAARPLLEPLVSEGGARVEHPDRFLLFDAVTQLVGALAGEEGLMLVLEDLHWADADTLDLIDHLSDNLAGLRVVCLGTLRDDPGPAFERVQVLAARRSALLLPLARLSSDEVAEMTRAALGVDAVQPALVEALAARAEGVPFVIEEMLTAYVASGGDVASTATIPQTFRDLVRMRLDALDDETRRVVSAAAVIGRRFEWSLLTRVTGLDRHRVLDALRNAVRAQLVVVESGRFEMPFGFRHALVREAVVAELLPPERAELCALAAEAIEDRFPGLPGEWCERAADLREAAGDASAAARHLQEAARRALARGALASAEAMLERARSLIATDPWHMIGVDRQLVDVLSLAGKIDRLREIGAVAVSFVGQKRAKMPFARLGLGDLHLRLARGMIAAGDSSAADDHLEQARTYAAESGERHLVARVRVFEARLALERGDSAEALMAARDAAEGAGELGLVDVVSEALSIEGRAAFLAGDAERALRTLERSRDAAPPVARVSALLELGEIASSVDGSLDTLVEARAMAAATGAVSSEARADLVIGAALLDRFALDEAREPLARCVDTCRRYRLAVLADALDVEAQRLALAGSEAEAEVMMAQAPGGGMAPVVLALLREEHDGARAALVEAKAGVRTPGPVAIAVASLLTGAEPGPGIGAHALATGLVAFAGLPRSSDPPARWDACDVRLERFPWWRHFARRLVCENAIRDGWGDPATWIRESLSFFDEAGHVQIASACKALLRRAGAPVPRKGRGESNVPAGLSARGVTSREMDVLRLILDGLGNREIAKRLFLSPRTVESHVASLMRKMQAPDRASLVTATQSVDP